MRTTPLLSVGASVVPGMKAKLFVVFAVYASAVPLVGCNRDGEPDPAQFFTSPSGVPVVVVEPATATKVVGQSQAFTARVTGGNSVSNAVKWSIPLLNSAVTIDERGVAHCQSPIDRIQVRAEYVGNSSAIGFGTLTCEAPPAPPAVKVVEVSPETINVAVDRSANNQLVCPVLVENVSSGPVTMKFTSEHAALAFDIPAATLPAGGKVTATVFYNGPQNNPFSTRLNVTATAPDGTQVILIPVGIAFK
jgi:hypothetical protein